MESDPSHGVEVALKKYKRGHFASLSVDKFPKFLIDLHNYQGRLTRQTYLAIRLMFLTFVRTKELIQVKWTEIDFDKALWIIPAERMKMRSPHLVPLSKQATRILEELKQMNGKSEYVFPGFYRHKKHMSNGTILVALGRMGYTGKMTGHGFRSLALGILKEKLGYSHEIADRQLAHVPKSSTDRAYDRAQFLKQRTEMMQTYATYLDDVFIEELKNKNL
ncbi:tyrosine-type recombinase/integrase [Chitinophaga oryziterrae]|nr:site-specific integrase [Chitinophaga oryziterrae]